MRLTLFQGTRRLKTKVEGELVHLELLKLAWSRAAREALITKFTVFEHVVPLGECMTTQSVH